MKYQVVFSKKMYYPDYPGHQPWLMVGQVQLFICIVHSLNHFSRSLILSSSAGPSDKDLLSSMMSRLAQVEQQLKVAQMQLIEKVQYSILQAIKTLISY